MKFRAIVFAILAIQQPLMAQVRRVTVPGRYSGSFISAPAVRAESARGDCLTLGDDVYGDDVKQLGACTANRFVNIPGVAAGHRWAFGVYGTRWLLPRDSAGGVDTTSLSEIVLFASAPGDSLLTPVWHYRFEDDMLRSDAAAIDIAPVGDRGALVAELECVNGTGGCTQGFFVYRAGAWRAVKTAFLGTLERKYPGAIQHGFHVNVRTMQADAAVYSSNDPNCCPSHSAYMKLRLRDEALEIVSVRLGAP